MSRTRSKTRSWIAKGLPQDLFGPWEGQVIIQVLKEFTGSGYRSPAEYPAGRGVLDKNLQFLLNLKTGVFLVLPARTFSCVIQKIIEIYMRSPASGPLRGTAGHARVMRFSHRIRRGGVPSGAAAFIISWIENASLFNIDQSVNFC